MARRDRRRKEAGAFAASVLVHLGLLAVLARVVVPAMYTPPTSPAPDVQLQLVNAPPPPPNASPPRPSRRAASSRATTAPAVVRTPERRAAHPLRAIQVPSRPIPPRATPAPPTPPAHAFASSPAAGAQNGTARSGLGQGQWKVEGEDDGQDGVRRFLRATVGCSHEDYVRLSTAERANCDRRMGEEARTIGIPLDKLGDFIAAAQAQERARSARTGPLADPLAPCPGASNFSPSCVPPKSRE